MISSLRVEINDSEVYHTEPETKELSGGKAPLHRVGNQHCLFVCVGMGQIKVSDDERVHQGKRYERYHLIK